MDLPAQANAYMQNMTVKYAICGGFAVDLFLGHKTRPHKDLDVAVFREDRDRIVQHMLDSGWSVYEPCGCECLHKINSVENQMKIKANIWCIKPDNVHYRLSEKENNMFAVEHDGSEQTELDFVEFIFNEHADGCFLYARNNGIKREMDKAILNSNGILYLAPELVLLYKSTAINNPDYQHDFETLLPFLDDDRRNWLKNALDQAYVKGHEWADMLGSINSGV
jgi:hypothetical protein